MSKGAHIVGLDLDGVLYPYHEAFYDYYRCEYGYEGSISEFWNVFWNGLTTEQQAYYVSIPIPYDTIVPSKKVMDFLHTLEHDADDVYYITSRYPELERVTERYLRRYDFPFQQNLILTKNKDIECVRHGITHFIDDFGKHVEPVSRICKAYLMAAIHNKEEQEKFHTVHSLEEFYTEVFSQ